MPSQVDECSALCALSRPRMCDWVGIPRKGEFHPLARSGMVRGSEVSLLVSPGSSLLINKYSKWAEVNAPFKVGLLFPLRHRGSKVQRKRSPTGGRQAPQ
jgi:hypothetical protein